MNINLEFIKKHYTSIQLNMYHNIFFNGPGGLEKLYA